MLHTGSRPLLDEAAEALEAARLRGRVASALGYVAALCCFAAFAGLFPTGALRGSGSAAVAISVNPPVGLAEEPQDWLLFRRVVAWWIRHAAAVQLVSTCILCTMFIHSGLSKGLGGFTALARDRGCPAPGFWGLMAVLFDLGGAASLLVGMYLTSPVLIAAGAKTLFIYLCAATWLGHIQPMRSAEGPEKVRHARSLMCNISLAGFMLIIWGRALAVIPEGTPLVAPLVPMYHSLAPWFIVVGKILAVALFLLSGLKLNVKGFAGIARDNGWCAPPFWGIMATLFTTFGALCVMFAPFIPRDQRVWYIFTYFQAQAFWSIVGDKLLIIFLLVATYVGHIRPGRTGTEGDKRHHFLATLRNVSIMGGLCLNLGYDLQKL